MTDIAAGIRAHVDRFWPANRKDALVWDRGPIRQALPDWQVLRILPAATGDPWVIYVTVGAWAVRTNADCGMEFLLLAPAEDPMLVETLAMVSNFHADPRYTIHYGKVLDIGRPWLGYSRCTHFLVSHPYPFGPEFEFCCIDRYHVRFLWLMPITSSERNYLETHGQEALERRFEEQRIIAVDPRRPSVA